MNRSTFLTAFAALMLLGCSNNTEKTQPDEQEHLTSAGQAIDSLLIKNLLRDSLELKEGVEVVVSYLEIPKGTTLPTHYHPGEEFVYILEGAGEISLKDQSKRTLNAGDVFKVPLRHVHSFSTVDQDVKGLVFRVHESGQPDRILVE